MRLLSFLALALAAALPAAELPFKMPKEYSCDMVMKQASSGEQVKGRMHVATGKKRMDLQSPMGEMVMIVRLDSKQMHMLMPAQKMVMTQPLTDEAAAKILDPTDDPSAVFTKDGSETVNGVACDRYTYKTTSESGTVWIDAKQAVPVKALSKDGDQVDFSNYALAAPKAELFEVPADYKPMDLGGMGPPPQ